MTLFTEDKWVVMSKDRNWIVKGTVQGRHLIRMDSRDKKRILTYNSAGQAYTATKNGGFSCKAPPWGEWSNMHNWCFQNLEPVSVQIIIQERDSHEGSSN